MFRWLALLVFVASFGISAAWRWRAGRRGHTIDRGEEPARLIAGRILVAGPLFGSVLAYFVSPSWMGWGSLSLPSWLRWGGVALGALVVPSVYWVLSTLGNNVSPTVLTRQDQDLVTSGPYRCVRHPLYTVGIALFLSVGLMAANAFILAWTLVALIAVRWGVIPPEETELVATFGTAYRQYRQRTGAMLPRLSGGENGADAA